MQLAEEDDLVKVHFELKEPDMGSSGESLWAAPVGSNLYELRNSPWHVRTVNWLDVVEAIPEAEDLRPEFVRVHERSGHRTIHLFISDVGQSSSKVILHKCNQLGATYEGMNNRVFALDFAPEIDIAPAIQYLQSMQECGWADWRINECD
jgi:hypothetical protein